MGGGRQQPGGAIRSQTARHDENGAGGPNAVGGGTKPPFAMRTITDNGQRVRQWAGGCCTAAPGDIQDTPPLPKPPGAQGTARAARLRTPAGGGGGGAPQLSGPNVTNRRR